MKRYTNILMLLACFILASPAICADIGLSGGSNNVVSSSGGVVYGGDFFTVDADSTTELGYTAGLRAHAELPAGSQGYAYSHWSRANNTSMDLVGSNGNEYLLNVSYSGTVNADVIKTSADGRAVSDAEISASAHADAITNHIGGAANISASTSNTGVGSTRAMAVGDASYNVRQTACSDPECTPGREVYGDVSGSIDLNSINLDKAVSMDENATGSTQGSVYGSAYIRSTSEADNTTSTANTTMSVDTMEAMRLGAEGVSHISAAVLGNARSGAWNEGILVNATNGNDTNGNDTNGNDTNGNDTNGNDTNGNDTNGNITNGISNVTRMPGTNESAFSQVMGTLGAMADAHAPGDRATSSNSLISEATNTKGGDFNNMTNTTSGDYYNATNTANTAVSVVRTDTSYPATAASAVSTISSGSFSSAANSASMNATQGNDTQGNDTQSPIRVEESADRIDMRSAISAKNAWAGDNSISATLKGLYDNRSGDAAEIRANISNTVVNNGPVMNSSAADFSIADEAILGQHASSTNGTTATASVDVANKSILSFISGNTSTPGGIAVLGPVSDPVFDNSTGAQHNVTGPLAVPGQGMNVTNATQGNSILITYSATSYFPTAGDNDTEPEPPNGNDTEPEPPGGGITPPTR